VHRRFQKVVVSWLLVVAIGGHWPLLQSVAWMKMFVEFSQTDDFTTAVVKTFNGKNLCSLCKLVREGKETEQKQTAQVSKLKVDLFFAETDRYPIEARPFVPPEAPASFLTLFRGSPPSPPPKPA